MMIPGFLHPSVRGLALAAMGSLLLAAPTAFAGPGASPTSSMPSTGGSAVEVTEPVASSVPGSGVRKALLRMQKPGKTPVSLGRAKGGLHPVAPNAASPAPDSVLNLSKAPEANRNRQQAMRRFAAQVKQAKGEMLAERQRRVSQQESQLAQANERTMAKIRSHLAEEGL